jgi:hypothetical protein
MAESLKWWSAWVAIVRPQIQTPVSSEKKIKRKECQRSVTVKTFLDIQF